MKITGLISKTNKQFLEFEDGKTFTIIEVDVSEAMNLREILNKYLMNFQVLKRDEYIATAKKNGSASGDVVITSTQDTQSASNVDNMNGA